MKSQSRRAQVAKAALADWTQIEEKFRAAGTAAPQAGFSDRWQARWQERQRKRQRGLNNGRVLVNGLIVLTLLTLWGFATWFIMQMALPFVAERLGSSLNFLVSIVTACLAVLKAMPVSVLMVFGMLLTAAVLESAMSARMHSHAAARAGEQAKGKGKAAGRK
jgi:hypothetical protein